MKVTIVPTRLKGTITPPPSKSQAHRLVLAAALGSGVSTLENVALSQDIQATLSCVEQLGASWTHTAPGVLRITGAGRGSAVLGADGLPHFDCGESGSTLRFLIPIALALCGGGVFTGRGRLMERPQQPYFDLFAQKGIQYDLQNGALTVRGELKPGMYALAGNVSSQFFTGLLYALSLLDGPSTLMSTTRLESVDYIMMTLDALELAGIHVKPEGGLGRMAITPGCFRPFASAVEADWSQAAFWYGAAGIGNEVSVTGMRLDSHQGDKAILSWGVCMSEASQTGGISVPIWVTEDRTVEAEEAHTGHVTSIDVSPCPDLVPPAAAWAALLDGTVYLENAGRLRIKESDRLTAVAQTLTALGGRVWEEPERLIIQGVPRLRGGTEVDCCNDHRIAMMAAIAATRCTEPVTLLGAECVRKSYPNFWEDYEKLGGQIQREE